VHTQQWEYEAGWNEDVGRVMEPRNRYSCGPQDIPQATARESRRRAVAGRQQSGSGRQGRSPVGESPTVPIARFGHVAISQFMMGNHMSIA
jgi:hypothetical protein